MHGKFKHGGWIGVDLDGTLAHYEQWISATVVGKPIPEMIERVKRWVDEGYDVRIFTDRVSHDSTPLRMVDAEHARQAIERWCVEHIGVKLPVTCCKDYAMVELWDDRAVQVETNTGKVIGRSRKGLE